MSGLNRSVSPNTVLSGLDEVFFSKFNERPGPNMAHVLDGDVFVQSSTDRGGIITEIMKDAGMWEQRNERQDLVEGNVVSGQKRTFTVSNFAQSLGIPQEYFEDEQYGTVKETVRKMALKARLTDLKTGFGIYRGAFDTTLTNDGAALISDSHTNLNGDTVDNKITSSLSESSLNDAIQLLAEQKDQAGDVVGHEASCLLVPNKLFKTACEISDSELRSGTADNDLNVYLTKYNIWVKQSVFIGSAYGGSDTAWFLLSKDHNVTRWNRKDITTSYVEPQYSKNNTGYYKGHFRNVYGAVSYEGLVGSPGLA